jgi:hypothetical protein
MTAIAIAVRPAAARKSLRQRCGALSSGTSSARPSSTNDGRVTTATPNNAPAAKRAAGRRLKARSSAVRKNGSAASSTLRRSPSRVGSDSTNPVTEPASALGHSGMKLHAPRIVSSEIATTSRVAVACTTV